MALSGNLSEFSVPEVLQLLALQQKSGVLTLSHDKGDGYVLFFERGKILAAADPGKLKPHPFLTALIDNLHLNHEQLETVTDISAQTGQDIFTVLLTSGLMGRDRLGEEMHRYAQRMVDDIVGWRSGSYEFSGDERNLPHQGLVTKVSPEELLMESMRRNDELATLKDSLIASDLVLTKSPNPPSEPLPRECQVVLQLVNGRRTVDAVCRKSPMGDYLTYDAIAELLGRQQVMVLEPAQAARFAAPTKLGWRAMSPMVFAGLLLPVALSVLLGLAVSPLLNSGEDGWLPRTIHDNRQAAELSMEAEIARLNRTLHQPTPPAPTTPTVD